MRSVFKLLGNVFVVPAIVIPFMLGCCTSVHFVAIPPEDFRSQKEALPLTQKSSEGLLMFLRSGADRSKMPDVVDLGAGKYAPLLALLRDTAFLKIRILEGDTSFRRWFHDKATYGVIDARDESMTLLDMPVSYLTNDRYWWVFYRLDSVLTHVLVVKNVIREPGEGE